MFTVILFLANLNTFCALDAFSIVIDQLILISDNEIRSEPNTNTNRVSGKIVLLLALPDAGH